MKKLSLILCLGLFVLAGCSDNDDDYDRLEDRVEALEKQSLKTNGQNGSDTSNDKASEEKDFSTQVADMVKSLEAITTVDQYQPIKLDLEALEDEMDLYDDTKEKEYRASTITKSAYRTIEANIEGWENQLDTAQDALELKLGIDD